MTLGTSLWAGTGILSQLMAKATGALPEVIQALIELDRART